VSPANNWSRCRIGKGQIMQGVMHCLDGPVGGCALVGLPPGEYSGSIGAAAAMRRVAATNVATFSISFVLHLTKLS